MPQIVSSLGASSRPVRTINYLALLLLISYSCNNVRDQHRFKIGFSQCCNDAWRDVMNGEMNRELLLHPELTFDMRVANNDSENQVEQIRELATSGIDLLMVSPNEAEPLTPVIEEVYQSGLPVILIDRKTTSSNYTAFLGADNTEIGRTAGRFLASRSNGDTVRIIEILLPRVITPAAERNGGFNEIVAQHSNLVIVDRLETFGGHQDVAEHLPEILAKHPRVDVIYAHTDLLAETAHDTAKKLGRHKEIWFIGIDGIPGTGQGIQAVEDGILEASMLYPTGGVEAIRLATSILNNLPFEKENKLESIVIEKNNASILHNQMKKVFSLQESIDLQVQNLDRLQGVYQNQRVFIGILLTTLLSTVALGIFLWRALRSNQIALKSLEQKNQEILAHERQIIQMSEDLQEATQAKVDFFTHISHEFRTPLTLILGFTEDLVPELGGAEEHQHSVVHIQRNAYRLLRLVNQLMDFRKVESKQMQLWAAEHDLIGFIEQIMASYSKIAERRNIEFRLLSRQPKVHLWFDVAMLDKVLFNLLSNAFKNTTDGGKILVSVQENSLSESVTLEVEDNGRGMTEEESQLAFEPFFQSSGQQLRGTGLGLSLSKLLVELHGGQIKVESKLGKGSRFQVILRQGKNHFAPGQITDKPQSYLPENQFLVESGIEHAVLDQSIGEEKDQYLLIIEDNPDLQQFLRLKLLPTFQIIQANNGEEGLRLAEEKVPDLILCDLNLPDIGGLEVIQRLKKDIRTSHIPICILTARSSMEQQIEGINAGADDYIIKPFNISFLFAKINGLLKNRHLLREAFGTGQALHDIALPGLAAKAEVSEFDQKFLNDFNRFLTIHFQRQDFQVSDICEEFGLSRSQLYRKVKALTGESISNCLENIRLQHAESLLVNSKQTVAEIAYQVGYSAPDYFSTVFKARYGMTPSKFRKQREN